MSKNRELTDRERQALDRLGAALNQQGMSWQQASTHVGKSANLGNQWSSRRAFPQERDLYTLAQHLGVTMGWLLTGEEPTAETTAITATEREMLAALRQLPPDMQRVVLAQVEAAAHQITKK